MLEDVVREYGDMVYRLAFAQTRNKADADDVFQEVFLRYLRREPQLESEEHRKAWLLRVTVNCARKLWSSPWSRRTQPLEEDLPFQAPEEWFLHQELKKLPERYRTVIHLFYYEDMTVEQISTALGRKPGTVRAQLTRGRQQLKEILGEDYADV